VRERLGVSPEGVTTFKALAGDASDNIPGVKGIGSKSAVELVNRLGPLERIYGRLAELPGRTAALLEAGRDDAFLFRDIVTLRTDLELPVAVDELPEPQFRVDSKVREVLAAAGYD
jgi:DNA polymerase-1